MTTYEKKFGDITVRIRRLTVAESGAVLVAMGEHTSNPALQRATGAVEAIRYGVESAGDMPPRPKGGWRDGELDMLHGMIGTGPFHELGAEILVGNLHIASAQKKAELPSGC